MPEFRAWPASVWITALHQRPHYRLTHHHHRPADPAGAAPAGLAAD